MDFIIEQVFFFSFFCNSSPTCRGRRILAIYYVKVKFCSLYPIRMIYTVYNRHSPVGMNTLFIHTSIVPHSTEGVFDLCNIADLLIYSLLVKSMTTFIIFIFFMISIPFAPNDTYSPFLVDFPFFTIQGTCRPAVNNIPIEKQLV